MSKLPRRFYESVRVVTKNLLTKDDKSKWTPSVAFELGERIEDGSICPSSQCYGIELDNRPLRTQAGRHFTLYSLPLALAIAQEWRTQREVINLARMRLTGLAFTAVDNPLDATKSSLTNKIFEYLETDTLLYFANRDDTGGERLLELQQTQWAPVIRWVNKRLDVSLLATQHITDAPSISDESRRRLERYLLSHNFASLTGLLYGVESVKSLLITMAVVGRCLNVEDAVGLARLEQSFQTDTWGNVEWCHDVEKLELTSRLAAGVLFANLCSNVYEPDLTRADEKMEAANAA